MIRRDRLPFAHDSWANFCAMWNEIAMRFASYDESWREEFE